MSGGDGTVSYLQPAAISAAYKYLPQGALFSITEAVREGDIRESEITELRLRLNMQLSLSVDRANVRVAFVCRKTEMEYVANKLYGGCAYAYEHHLREGYIPLDGGMRVAVNTAVRYTDGKLRREPVPYSVVFRIPKHTEGQSKELARLMAKNPGGMLIFSPPAVGKTTVLRDLVIALSGTEHSMRVAVIDCRCEIDDGLFPECCLADIVSGCGRAEGMEWALRTLSPQIIAVDELAADDVPVVTAAALCGVPVIATAHAGSFEEMLARREIRDAFSVGAFSYLVALKRRCAEAPRFEIRGYSEGRWSVC